MSWNKQRVYRCDVCGNEEHARAYEPGRVPLFWRHSGGRRGVTICDECCAAISWARTAREKEQEQEQGGERCGGLVGALQTMLYGGPSDDKED